MAKITFVASSSAVHTVDARAGETIMEAAVMNGVDGIIADCGGSLSCATCHVYVEADASELFGTMGEYEDAMLEEAASERRDSSRLSCQLRITDSIDHVTVEIPPEQV